MSFLVIFLIILVLLLLFEVFYARKTKIAGKRLPGPTVYPLIGNAHLFIGDSVEFFRTVEYFVANYGDRTRAFIGPKLIVLLTNPEDVEVVMSSMKFIDKSDEYYYLRSWLGEGLLTSSGNKWKRHRKFLTPAFHFNILQHFIPVIEQNVDKLVQKFSNFANGEPVDIYPFVTLCALDVITEATMGVSVNAQIDSESDYVNAVRGISEVIHFRMRHMLLRQDFFYSLSFSKLTEKKYLKRLFDFTDDVIKKRKISLGNQSMESYNAEGNSKRKVAFLDLLLLSEIDGEKLSDKSIKDEVNTFMFEGHDTTASGVSFTLYCISKNEDVQKKLYEEQKEIFGEDMGRNICFSDLPKMKFMEQVIKESLRLYPSVPYIARQIPEDCEINGLFLPKGASIMASIYHLHRHPMTCDDPYEFKPERFSTEQENVKKNAYGYIPFSAGPRNCIGQKFAMIEMKMTLSKLIRNFQLHSSNTDLILSAELILKSVNGIPVKLTKRA